MHGSARLVIWIVSCFPAALLAEPGSLRSPFDSTPFVQSSVERSVACPKVPTPTYRLEGVRYYVDEKKSAVDPELFRRNRLALKSVDDLANVVIGETTAFLKSGRVDAWHALCVVEFLDSWAKAGALSGPFNSQGRLQLNWTVNLLAINYLVVRSVGSDEQRSRISRWLMRLGNIIRANAIRQSLANNLLYWAGAAAAACGIAADDVGLYSWGVEAARKGVLEIRPDGALNAELGRGARAMGYHTFALSPLVMTAELAAANGTDLYAENSGGISRLVNFVIVNLGDCRVIEQMIGDRQKCPPVGTASLAWAEAYYARFKDVRLKPWLVRLRPIVDAYSGGNTTLIYGKQ